MTDSAPKEKSLSIYAPRCYAKIRAWKKRKTIATYIIKKGTGYKTTENEKQGVSPLLALENKKPEFLLFEFSGSLTEYY